jgi:hypothetical protein
MKPLSLLALLMAGVLMISSVQAFEANKRRSLPPGAQLKVNKALALGYREGQLQADNALTKSSAGQPQIGCGNLSLGNVSTPRPVASVENVTVVRGDVININRNTNCR